MRCYSLSLGSSEYSPAFLGERLEEMPAMRSTPNGFRCLSHAVTSIMKNTAKQTEGQANVGHLRVAMLSSPVSGGSPAPPVNDP